MWESSIGIGERIQVLWSPINYKRRVNLKKINHKRYPYNMYEYMRKLTIIPKKGYVGYIIVKVITSKIVP